MIIIKDGSHAKRIIKLLLCTGEFPYYSLGILGEIHSVKRAVKRMSEVHEVRVDSGDQIYYGKIVNISGKGQLKTVRLNAYALPLVESLFPDMMEFYRYHIVNGDSEFSVVSRDLIKGIVMSHNERMHQLLCKLLVAAKLQEGLRQAVCEEADGGTVEAFHAILSTILEHDLIRYSSVKRAVGTWIGVMTEETRDLDRISNKSVEIICKCLTDAAFREESSIA